MIDDLAKRVPHIWVSLDLDSIDKAYAPGVGIPNDQGFTYREITTIAEYIGSHCPVAGLDIVEYNPKNDIQHKTAELAITLTATLLGQEYSSYTSYLGHSARD
jgi:arginase family enzyme